MQRRRAFTMIELMIVITIISLLMALLLPTLRHAIETAHRHQCRTNLAMIGAVLNLYAAANNKEFPPQYVPTSGALAAAPNVMDYDGLYQTLRTNYNLDERILACPTRPQGLWVLPTAGAAATAQGVKSNWITSGDCVLTSYSLCYGLNPAPNGLGTPASVVSTETPTVGSPMGRRYDNGRWILAADLAMSFTGGPTPDSGSPMVYNHSTAGKFEGGNVLTVGGGVEWMDADAWLTGADKTTVATGFTAGGSGNGTFYDGASHTWWWPAYAVPE